VQTQDGSAALTLHSQPSWPVVARAVATVAAGTLVLGLVVWTAILAKESSTATPLMVRIVRPPSVPAPHASLGILTPSPADAVEAIDDGVTIEVTDLPAPGLSEDLQRLCADPSVRWFNGRPVKPAKIITMKVTGYSPDARSCGDSADGLTATMHSVETNAHRLVAADPSLLPYGSMLTVPGYADNEIVPVLDCGGAIKGKRLDLLFPTHGQARQWGVQTVRVIVWKHVDGLPPDNPRKLR
jgi:3D (Asp-Asp-Asp) domain-containing protein